MIKVLHLDERYKYKSQDEFVNEHKRIINEMHKHFIEKNNIKENLEFLCLRDIFAHVFFTKLKTFLK